MDPIEFADPLLHSVIRIITKHVTHVVKLAHLSVFHPDKPHSCHKVVNAWFCLQNLMSSESTGLKWTHCAHTGMVYSHRNETTFRVCLYVPNDGSTGVTVQRTQPQKVDLVHRVMRIMQNKTPQRRQKLLIILISNKLIGMRFSHTAVKTQISCLRLRFLSCNSKKEKVMDKIKMACRPCSTVIG